MTTNHNEANWVDALSDLEDLDTARRARVASHAKVIFDSLMTKFEDAATIYNKRHAASGGLAVVVAKTVESGSFVGRVQKKTAPQSSLTLTIAIDDGVLQYEVENVGESQQLSVAELDIKGIEEPKQDGFGRHAITLQVNGHPHSEESFVRHALEHIWFSKTTIEKSENPS